MTFDNWGRECPEEEDDGDDDDERNATGSSTFDGSSRERPVGEGSDENEGEPLFDRGDDNNVEGNKADDDGHGDDDDDDDDDDDGDDDGDGDDDKNHAVPIAATLSGKGQARASRHFRFRSTTPWFMMELSRHFQTAYDFYLTSEYDEVTSSGIMCALLSIGPSTRCSFFLPLGKHGLSGELIHDLRSWGLKVPTHMYYKRLRENHHHHWQQLHYKYLMFIRSHSIYEVDARIKRGEPGLKDEFPRCVKGTQAFPSCAPLSF